VTLTVLKPGAYSQLQDLGRYGYQRFGVLVGGAMDDWAHRFANALVGNEANEATLEITLTGPTLRFDVAAIVAVCGADLSPRIDGAGGSHALPHGRPVLVEAGSQLRFGARMAGARAYLAVRGGFDVPPVMGSRSTYVRGGFGGYEGRALRKDDVLRIREAGMPRGRARAGNEARNEADNTVHNEVDNEADNEAAGRAALTLTVLPTPIIAPVVEVSPLQTIRIIAGRHWDLFTAQARRLLLDAEYRIGGQSDRMGYRLEGPPLARERELEMISEAVTFGTVQVPPDGMPIILMADRQTTGGYPKIASVAGVDLRVLAQMAAPQALRFELISLADAQRIYLAREREYSHVRHVLEGHAR
jgi:urea carboxylase